MITECRSRELAHHRHKHDHHHDRHRRHPVDHGAPEQRFVLGADAVTAVHLPLTSRRSAGPRSANSGKLSRSLDAATGMSAMDWPISDTYRRKIRPSPLAFPLRIAGRGRTGPDDTPPYEAKPLGQFSNATTPQPGRAGLASTATRERKASFPSPTSRCQTLPLTVAVLQGGLPPPGATKLTKITGSTSPTPAAVSSRTNRRSIPVTGHRRARGAPATRFRSCFAGPPKQRLRSLSAADVPRLPPGSPHPHLLQFVGH